MATRGGINLIAVQQNEYPGLPEATRVVTNAAYGSLLILVVAGLATGAAYSYFSQKQQQVLTDQTAITQSVSNDSLKEGLLLAVKQRSAVSQKLLGSKKDTDAIFSLIAIFIPPSSLSSITIDDTDKTIMSAHVASISEAVPVVDGLLAAVDAGKASKPILEKFILTKDGGLDLTMSFVPIL